MQRVNARNVLKEEMQGSVQKTVKGSPGGAAWIALNSSMEEGQIAHRTVGVTLDQQEGTVHLACNNVPHSPQGQ